MVPSAGSASIGGYVSRRALSTTSAVSMGKLQKFKDKFILSEADAHKRPSDLEIAKKKLPRNTPTLAERVKRDSAGPLWVPDRHSGYHKGLTGTWRDYVDPNATALDIVKDSISGWKKNLSMLREESKSWFTFAAKDLPKHGEERVEFTFDNPAKISDEWIVTCDSTWGEGYSTATLTESPNAKGKALFSGNLDTKPPNDGRVKQAGYCNIRSVHRLQSFGRIERFNWLGFTHLVLRLRGDGRNYTLNLHPYMEYDIFWNDLFTYPLYTRGGPYWQTIVIPFEKFYLTHMGRIQDDQPLADTDVFVAIGITLMDRIDGPFNLELDSIKVRQDLRHFERRTSPYETYKYPRKGYNW